MKIKTIGLCVLMAPVLASTCFPLFAQQSPVPDYYSEPGVVPFREQATGSDGHEHIDPFSGQLHLSYIDISVPGNGGLDLNIVRAYNNLNEVVGIRTQFGLGWKIDFGKVLSSNPNIHICDKRFSVASDNNPVLELPDGSRQILYTADAPPYSSYTWITQERWKAVCGAGSVGLVVTSPQGLIYIMSEPAGSNAMPGTFLTKKIQDRHGNWIDIAYRTGSVGNKLIDKITTSDGRSVQFNYLDVNLDTYRLESIAANGNTWTYEYQTLTEFGPYRYQLSGVRRPDGSYWRYAYFPSSVTAGRYSLQTVTHPYGGVTTYEYRRVAFDPYATGYLTTAVNSKTVTGPRLKSAQWTYVYQPGASYDTTAVDGPQIKIEYQHFGYSASISTTAWKIGSLLQKKTINKSTGATLETETYTWDKQLISYENQARSSRALYDTESYAPLLTGKVVSRESTSYGTTFSNFDEHGNARKVTETGPAGTRVTDYEYLNHTASWLLRTVKTQTIQGIGTISRTFFSNGNLESESKYGVTTRYTYSSQGDVASVKNARNAETKLLNYKRGIPQTEQAPESLTITRGVNDSGTIAWIKDARLYTTSFVYDGLNRPKTVTYPNGKFAPLTVSWQTSSRISTRIGAKQTFQEVVNFDGFGRPNNTKRNSIITTIKYDEYGRKTFESYPCVPTGTECTVGKQFEYDALDRISKVKNNDTERTYSYKPNGLVEVRNERLFLFKFIYKAYGDPNDVYLARIETPKSTTDISRNAIKQLTSIVQGGLTRSYDYYPTTRFIKTISDPETGVTLFTQDEVGNIKTRRVNSTSAYPSTTTYVYNLLDRPKEVTHTAPAGPSSIDTPVPMAAPKSTFAYDQNGNVKTAIRGCRSITYYYDEFNYPTTETHADTCAARSWTFTWTYDDLNHKDTLTYPSGIKVSYAPDALGRPTTALPQVTGVTYWPSGLVKTTKFANGLTTTSTQTQRLQLDTLITTDTSGNSYVWLNYDYDNLDNPYAIKDFINSQQNVTLSYDAEDRIDTATGSWGTGGDMDFDAAGNITLMKLGNWTSAPHYDPISNLPNYVLRNGTSLAYAHDLQGNVRLDGVRRFRFDTENRLVSVANLSGTTQFTQEVDASGQSAKRVQSGSPTYYVYARNGELIGEYGSAAGSILNEYVYLGPTVVASTQPNPTRCSCDPPPGSTIQATPPEVLDVPSAEELTAFLSELESNQYLYEPAPPLPSEDLQNLPSVSVEVEELPYAHIGDPVDYLGFEDDLTPSIGHVPQSWQDPGIGQVEAAPPGGGGGTIAGDEVAARAPPGGGGASASTTPINIYFVTNLLGSPVIGTNDSRTIKFREYYTPFGERERASGNAYSALWFTGKHQDQTSQHITMGSRQYDPLLGRFRSTDPAGVDPVKWPTFNRYAYGNNSPGKHVDPSGNIVETAIDVVSFGLSLKDFTANPSLGNGAALLFDGIALALPLVPGGAGIVRNATKSVAETVEKSGRAVQTTRGRSVLGSYPAYLEKADELGAKRFNVPTSIWNKMSDAERWGANQKFLDRLIQRGDEVILTTPVGKISPGTYLQREVDYLLGKGYQVIDEGTRLVPGR